MREPKVAKGEPSQQPICILNIVLPETIIKDRRRKKLKGMYIEYTHTKKNFKIHYKSRTLFFYSKIYMIK